MPTVDIPLGPGTLKIGATGSEIDASCLVNNARITTDKDQADSRTMLCGDVVPGAVTYTYRLTGNLDTDVATTGGLFELSQTQAGTAQAFEFVPNTAAGSTASGTLTLDPLDFGADETGAPLQSDFDWTIIGVPAYVIGGVVGTEAEPAA
jgi:hypothetical protein